MNPTTAVSQSAPDRPSPFRLVNVEKTQMPDGGSGQTWYRYLLENDRSTITGLRCGSLKDVTAYAKEYAEQLNARGIGGQTAWSPRAKKPA
jgi:hypothetical protein